MFCQSLGANGQFCNWYLEVVWLLLRYIRSNREANWKLYLQCLIEMTPYFFAHGRINYARYMPAYFIEMLTFHITHPDAHQSQLNGEFSVQYKRDRRNIAKNEEWSRPSRPYYFQKLKNKTLIVTLRDKWFRIMASRTQEVSALCCSHEEADIRILFHAGHDVECGTDVNSQDTGVAVLAILVRHEIPA